MQIQSSLDNLIFLILLVVTIIYWASLILPNFKFLTKIGFGGTFLANSLIFCLLGSRWVNYGYFPLSNLYESLLFLAWGITFTTLVLEYKSRTSIIGSISNPISLFIMGFVSLNFVKTKCPYFMYNFPDSGKMSLSQKSLLRLSIFQLINETIPMINQKINFVGHFLAN